MERVETGAYTFENDWAGLFIRGDDCMYLTVIIDKISRHKELTIFDMNFLFMLGKEIDKNVLHNIKE
jgi:hypothetical protein